MAQQGQRTNDATFPTIYKLSDDDRYLMPSDVSMGPYYWQRSSFLCREAEKQNYLTGLLSKFATEESQVEDLESDLLKKIGDKLSTSGQIVYYDDIPLPLLTVARHQELAKILLFDGCYLVANFVNMDQVMSTTTRTSSSSQVGGGGGGSSTTTTSTADDVPHSGPVVRDTWYLLQNQIPFFVLEEICTFVLEEICTVVTRPGAEVARTEFTKHAQTLLCNQKMLYYNTQPPAPAPPGDVFHLLHLLHTLLIKPLNSPAAAEARRRSSNSNDDDDDNTTMFQCLRRTLSFCRFKKNNQRAPSSRQTNDPENQRSGAADRTSDVDVGPWHRATEYRIYGNVVFESQKINGGGGNRRPAVEVLSVLDVDFNGRKVMVPGLHLDGHTCTLLRNLMALERHHPRLGTHVTAYCLFMSQMACTKEDVELLVRRGVIENHLGSPENVAKTLSELGSSIVLDISSSKRNYLKRLWHHLEKRYKSRPQNVMAWLSQNYFSWRNISVLLGVIAGLILLVAGVLSAVYQILTYKHPPKP